MFSIIPKNEQIKVVARHKGREVYNCDFQEPFQVEEAWKDIFHAVKLFFVSSVRQA